MIQNKRPDAVFFLRPRGHRRRITPQMHENHRVACLIQFFTGLFLSLLLVSKVIGQVENRIIPYPEWACEYEYDDAQWATPHDVHIELLDITVAGRTVQLGKPFKADGDWLKKMVLR